MFQSLRKNTITLLSLALVCSSSAAAELATIELTDGSTLQGELLSMQAGSYEIKTESLGVLKIRQDDVAMLRYKSASSTSASGADNVNPNAAALAGLQQQLIGNPETLSLIMGLGNDPAIQAIVADPEIKAAMARGDFATLMAHPKIQQMMRHPTVKKISGAVSP